MTQTIEVDLVDVLNRLDSKIDKLDSKIDHIQNDLTDFKIDVEKLKTQNEQLVKRGASPFYHEQKYLRK